LQGERIANESHNAQKEVTAYVPRTKWSFVELPNVMNKPPDAVATRELNTGPSATKRLLFTT